VLDDQITVEIVGVGMWSACEEEHLVPVDHAALILEYGSPSIAADLVN
jgi:hypothetical protein